MDRFTFPEKEGYIIGTKTVQEFATLWKQASSDWNHAVSMSRLRIRFSLDQSPHSEIEDVREIESYCQLCVQRVEKLIHLFLFGLGSEADFYTDFKLLNKYEPNSLDDFIAFIKAYERRQAYFEERIADADLTEDK